MFEKYIKYATESNVRLPKELRVDKKISEEFLNYLIKNKIKINNSAIFTLAQWLKIDLFTVKTYDKIKSIKFLTEKEMVGDLTVPDGNSYTANGVIIHNCNLPENATKELISQVYMRAWEQGCKGFTVYRDKCRNGVLINESESKKYKNGRPSFIEKSDAPKRPIELPCDIKKVKIQGEQWTIFVGMFNGKPYEIFGGLSKYVDIPNKFKLGKIIKNGKIEDITTYNLFIGEGDDQMIIKDIANVFENANFGAFTRTISLALRHGAPVQYVAEQLQKDKYSDITSFSKVIARVLKNYILDGTKSTVERQCPTCKKENSFAYQEKCLTCMSCGYSKCN